MAAWLKIAGQALRPAARCRETWRARVAFGFIYVFVMAWAAGAPQAALSLGQRLRLSFNALFGLCAIVAATSAIRRQFPIMQETYSVVRWPHRVLAQAASNSVVAVQELAPATPLFLFLAAVQVIGPVELIEAFGALLMIVFAVSVVPSVGVALGLVLLGCVVVVTWRWNYFETTIAVLLAIHLGLKGFIAWNAISSTAGLRRNLNDETITGLQSFEVATLHCQRLRRGFVLPLFGLAFVNIAFVFMLLLGVPFPATVEQKLALGLALTGGVALLFVDASALVWRGALSGLTTQNPRRALSFVLALVVGAPWAVAWIFSALHSGEAFTLNEGAAYFFMWLALGGTISWIARTTAKEKMQRDLCSMLSEQ